MLIFNTVRAGRQQEYYMEKLIHRIYSDARMKFKQGYGALDNSAEEVLHSFGAVQNGFKGYLPIKVHYMEMHIGYEHGEFAVHMIADAMGQYFFNMGYQCLISAVDIGDRFVVVMVVNSVPFNGYQLFHDNNDQHYKIYEYLMQILPEKWTVTATENTIFTEKRDGNYVHGLYA